MENAKMQEMKLRGFESTPVPICEECLKGKHLTYGYDHRLEGKDSPSDPESDEYGRRSCKSLGFLNGRRVQCHCNPDAEFYPELLKVIRHHSVKAGKESIMPNPAKYKNTEKGKKQYMGDCMHQVMHMERKEKDKAVAQCLNMWRAEHGGKKPPKKMAQRVASEFLKETV